MGVMPIWAHTHTRRLLLSVICHKYQSHATDTDTFTESEEASIIHTICRCVCHRIVRRCWAENVNNITLPRTKMKWCEWNFMPNHAWKMMKMPTRSPNQTSVYTYTKCVARLVKIILRASFHLFMLQATTQTRRQDPWPVVIGRSWLCQSVST